MTREEAIQRFNGIIRSLSISVAQAKFYPTKAELNELCDMAIEALQADSVQGEWILVKGNNGKDYHKCSKCLHTQEITGVKNYCAVCGARMKGGNE